MKKLHFLLNVGFPVYLILFEMFLRYILNVNASSFIPPTLAAGGLGFLISAVKPINIPLSSQLQQTIQTMGVSISVRSTKDDVIISLAWMLILVEVLTWYGCCALTLKAGEVKTILTLPFIIGVANYTVGIIVVSIKESQ